MNLTIKFRKGSVPSRQACSASGCTNYFDLDCDSPYMLLAAVKQDRQIPRTPEQRRLWGIDQTVSRDTNPNYGDLIKEFEGASGTPCDAGAQHRACWGRAARISDSSANGSDETQSTTDHGVDFAGGRTTRRCIRFRRRFREV